MARISLTFSILFIFSLYALSNHTKAAAVSATSPAANFIRTSCRATTYPTVCIESLATYAPTIQKSTKQLVMTALSVSADRAQLTKAFVSKLHRFRGLKPYEYSALKDCIDQVSDSVDHLTKSVQELKNMGRARGPGFTWHMSNVQTWVSAALTDDTTCADGLSGRAVNPRIKASIRSQMTHVAQVTSNALALCNKFAGTY